MLVSHGVDFLAACVQKGAEQCAQPASVSQDHFTVIIGAIVAGFSSLLTLVGILIQKQRSTNRHAAAASFGVNNNHESNLRDDLDAKFSSLEVKIDQKFERVFGSLGYLNGRMNGIDNTRDRVHLEDN